MLRNHITHNFQEWLPSIAKLNQEVFGESLLEKIQERLKTHRNGLLLTIGEPNELIGYKLGYAKSPTTFYSWLGAVSPQHRGQGYGRELMKIQHAWCQNQKYKKIQTKTLNQWKTMLTLNLAEGFDIVDTYEDKKGLLKILLEKKLH